MNLDEKQVSNDDLRVSILKFIFYRNCLKKLENLKDANLTGMSLESSKGLQQ